MAWFFDPNSLSRNLEKMMDMEDSGRVESDAYYRREERVVDEDDRRTIQNHIPSIWD